MSKASKIVVLCEDQAHEVFALRFLKTGWKIKSRHITVVAYPSGKGSGKKFVEEKLANEVAALRKRHATTILIVMRDADEDSVDEALRKLEAKIQPRRQADEKIAFVVPKWHIQTWFGYLDGMEIDESEKEIYKRAYGSISGTKQAHIHVDKLAGWCRKRQALESPTNSLERACEEFERIRNALGE